ncbi:MAG: hypothetical protein UT37_C0001G0024 [Parcubacteria group bacterium GW2011_GWA2_39_18]|nr:MAG: hypothetical protein UT37_C0001G0024 [Parcubacteria group bacterium GW2011_GWA2_39_18]
MMNNFIIDFSQQFSYTIAFVLLFLSGVGFPLPEEIVLFVLGYLIFLGQMHWWPVIILSLAGILLGDIAGYFFGLKKGEWLINLIKVKRFLPEHLFYKVEKFFKKHGNWAVFFARFFVGFRFYMCIVAGYFKMPLKKFIFYDVLGAILWTPFIIFLSYHVGNLALIIMDAKRITHKIYIVVGIFFLIILLINFLWEILSDDGENQNV